MIDSTKSTLTKKLFPVKNSRGIILDRELMDFPSNITEPFSAGRATSRLLFDFSAMIALLKPSELDWPVLDFGAGTGWISEFCARMGLQSVAFDIRPDLENCLKNRASADRRINEKLLNFAQGDGHHMPFENEVFGHLLCYDTLHHMHDYKKVFSEFFRVIKSGGRCIFVEPGARHSSSKETIEFLRTQKQSDPTWIERDIVLEEIDQIAREVGFSDGIFVVPLASAVDFQIYPLEEWKNFRSGNILSRLRLTDQLASLNYWDRVIFYVDKKAA